MQLPDWFPAFITRGSLDRIKRDRNFWQSKAAVIQLDNACLQHDCTVAQLRLARLESMLLKGEIR